MASWLQSQLKAAEGLLEAVDRTAKKSIQSQGQPRSQPGPSSREAEHSAPKGERRCLPYLPGTLHVSCQNKWCLTFNIAGAPALGPLPGFGPRRVRPTELPLCLSKLLLKTPSRQECIAYCVCPSTAV